MKKANLKDLMEQTVRDYEEWERYASEHYECKDCCVTLQKIRRQGFYCPSCGYVLDI